MNLLQFQNYSTPSWQASSVLQRRDHRLAQTRKRIQKDSKRTECPWRYSWKHSLLVQSWRNSGYTTWTWQKEEAISGCHQIPEEEVVENPRVTAKHLQRDSVAAGTEVSVCTVRRTLNTDGVPCPDSKTHTATDPKAQEKSAPICWKPYKLERALGRAHTFAYHKIGHWIMNILALVVCQLDRNWPRYGKKKIFTFSWPWPWTRLIPKSNQMVPE